MNYTLFFRLKKPLNFSDYLNNDREYHYGMVHQTISEFWNSSKDLELERAMFAFSYY